MRTVIQAKCTVIYLERSLHNMRDYGIELSCIDIWLTKNQRIRITLFQLDDYINVQIHQVIRKANVVTVEIKKEI